MVERLAALELLTEAILKIKLFKIAEKTYKNRTERLKLSHSPVFPASTLLKI